MSEPSRSDAALRATSGAVRIERFVYGGLGLGHVTDASAPQGAVLVPFVLPGELVTVEHSQDRREALLDQVIEASAERVEPGCPHFGVCGGCHLQMSSYPEQLRLKQGVLLDALRRAAVTNAPEPQVHAGEPWGYRNRIRLRLEAVDGQLRFGYTRHGAGQVFLPITTCPIAAPVLWQAAERMLARAVEEPALRQWLGAAREVEFFTTGEQKRLQILLLCPDSPKLLAKGLTTSFQRGFSDLASRLAHVVELAGAGAVQAFWSPLRLGRKLAEWGTPGLAYGVSTGFDSAVGSAPQEERYWVERGGFFQVNRYLLPTLVELVCAGHGGSLAWDLFAGVGLFARVLARRFEQVVAVEAHPGAASELARALGRLGPAHKAEQRTSISFLERAVLERDRPELVVLDPPRAGAGLAVCELLLRLRAPELVYVSCDPVTLCRDLAVLQRGYDLKALHLVDLFPQTYHQEAVVLLQRRT